MLFSYIVLRFWFWEISTGGWGLNRWIPKTSHINHEIFRRAIVIFPYDDGLYDNFKFLTSY